MNHYFVPKKPIIYEVYHVLCQYKTTFYTLHETRKGYSTTHSKLHISVTLLIHMYTCMNKVPVGLES